MAKSEVEVLRRPTFAILSWGFTIFFGGVIVAAASTLASGLNSVTLAVMCVSFIPIVVGRRI